MQKVLQLGGDKYTFEDLRRDLLSFEEESKTNKDIVTDDKSYEAEDRATMEHQCITSQILQELDNDEKEDEGNNKSETIKSAQENLEYLGIIRNQEGVKSPNYGKMKPKRGRKSLKELREADGKAQE